MKTEKVLASDLKIRLLERGKICKIKIDNPDWNWMMRYLSDGDTTMKIEWKILKNTDEKFWRKFISDTYNKNKSLILEIKMNKFQAY